MRRLLFMLMAVLGAFWWLRRSLGVRQTASRGTARGRETVEGAMVRDRICDTFLPRSKALIERAGAEEHFFCSEDCRRKFLAAQGAAPSQSPS